MTWAAEAAQAEVDARYGSPEQVAVAARRRRLIAAIVAGALIAGSAVAGAAFWVTHSAGEPIAGITPEGRAGLAESPTLSSAAWIFQGHGAPHIASVPRRAAIEFPPGTTYATALNALLRSVTETGMIPSSAHVVDSLPPGVVWRAGGSRRGPRLDLTAPWGYTLPGGLVRSPTLKVDPSIPRDRASAIIDAFMDGTPIGVGRARGLRADTPRLARCQVQALGVQTPSCTIAGARTGR